jgi:pyridoxal phosphate enzyme (YggS family)
MPVNKEAYQTIKKELAAKSITLVAVSKTKPVADILDLYHLGQRDFGENYVRELVEKATQLPKDIKGHLQSNKVKLIAPFVHLIHGVDSFKLLDEINKQALKNNRVIDCLLQVHIAKEETKFGLNEEELNYVIKQSQDSMLSNVRLCGLMGMATLSNDMNAVREEFRLLKTLFNKQALLTTHNSPHSILSMGMSSDYKIAIEEGSTMLRIGSLLFGSRITKQ